MFKNFHNPFKKSSRDGAGPQPEIVKPNESVSVPWKSAFSLFLTGLATIGQLEAAAAAMTIEERTQAEEFMRNAPNSILAFESKVFEMAKSEKAYPGKGSEAGMTKKMLDADSATAVHIEYANGEPVTVSVRVGSGRGVGEKTIYIDGYKGQKVDGIVDHVMIKNADGTKTEYSFVNVQGTNLVQLHGVSMTPAATTLALVTAQKEFHDGLQKVTGDASEVASVTF